MTSFQPDQSIIDMATMPAGTLLISRVMTLFHENRSNIVPLSLKGHYINVASGTIAILLDKDIPDYGSIGSRLCILDGKIGTIFINSWCVLEA